jgi:hypothetical protein
MNVHAAEGPNIEPSGLKVHQLPSSICYVATVDVSEFVHRLAICVLDHCCENALSVCWFHLIDCSNESRSPPFRIRVGDHA